MSKARRISWPTLVVTVMAFMGFATSELGASDKRRPSLFGRAYQKTRAAFVRVRASTSEKSATQATGFVVGTEGEILFSVARAPSSSRLVVTSATGVETFATLLGHDPVLGLAVARMERAQSSPLLVAEDPSVHAGDWLIVLKDSKSGPKPYAGLVTEVTARRRGPAGGHVLRLEAPADPGSPVLTTRGELVGIAVVRGTRRTRVLTNDAFIPFVRSVVLDERRRVP